MTNDLPVSGSNGPCVQTGGHTGPPLGVRLSRIEFTRPVTAAETRPSTYSWCCTGEHACALLSLARCAEGNGATYKEEASGKALDSFTVSLISPDICLPLVLCNGTVSGLYTCGNSHPGFQSEDFPCLCLDAGGYFFYHMDLTGGFGLDWICLTTTHVLQDILAVLHK